MEMQRWLCKEEMEVLMANMTVVLGSPTFIRWPNPLKAASTNPRCLGSISERSRN